MAASAWDGWQQLEKVLLAGEFLVIDGATGTEVRAVHPRARVPATGRNPTALSLSLESGSRFSASPASPQH